MEKIILLLFLTITVILLLNKRENFDDTVITLKNNLGKIYCPFKPDHVCNEIRKNKIWEENIQNEFEKYVKSGDTVIDAGAYIGIHTIKLSKLVGIFGLVHSFEPDPETFKILEKNIKLNNIKNVILYNVGLGDKQGTIKINKSFQDNKGATQWKYKDSFSTINSKIITIDSLNLNKLNFMKIDVEGMEEKVFIGMKNTIQKYKPVILLESFQENNEKNFTLLNTFGYTIKNIKDHDYIAVYKEYNEHSSSFTNVKSNVIPNIIHKIYINESMSRDENIINSNTTLSSWVTLNPGYTLKIWFGDECLKYLNTYFSQDHVDCFNKLKPYAYKADFMRYCILYNEGGWYTDWGQKLLVPLDTINKGNYDFVSCWDICWDYCINNKCMQNAFIGTNKKSDILKNVINKCINNIKNNYYGQTSLDVTGPYVFGKQFQKTNKKNIKYLLGTFEISKEYPNGFFQINNVTIISHKDDISTNNNYNTVHYTELWKNKSIYNDKYNKKSKSNFGNKNTCILLTTCVTIKTNYFNKYNTPRERLNMYINVINKWLNNTNLDIYVVESSKYPFKEFLNNPRIKIYSFESKSKYNCVSCDATPYEAESILLAFKNLNLKKYDKILKITGKYYLENFENLINKIPDDADIFFQNTQNQGWKQQNSELFGCKTIFLEPIMKLILLNSKKNMNFESTIYLLNDIKINNKKLIIYRFPKIKLLEPIRRSGDNSIINEL